jgi:light-regulated signal transduction histidine kinase (bacteriophytochrome)
VPAVTSRFSDRFDFTDCEDEPIRTPGAIQPHGFVILLNDESLAVTGFSANAPELVGLAFEPDEPALSPERMVLPELLTGKLRDTLAESADSLPFSFSLNRIQFSVSRRNGRVMLCGEPEDASSGITVEDLTVLIAGVKSAQSVDQLLNTAARAVRGITGFDRVMVYRFAADWHGEVVAESRAARMTSYLGVHFPATDIPAQARALYLENEIRMIADVDAETVPIKSLSELSVDTSPDLTDCPLRAVSPIHLQYLRNMGVAASMSISLIRDGKLWGLIACHHSEPRYVSLGARLSAKLVGDVLSLGLRLVEDSEMMEQRLQRRLLQSRVAEQCLKSDELVPTIVKASQEFRELFDVDSFAIVHHGQVIATGEGPSDTQLLILARHIGDRVKTDQQAVISWSRSETELFPDQSTIAAGVLAFAPSLDLDVLCLWTRKEEPLTINWAGRNEKQSDDPLNPRASFEQWAEIRQGVAKEWKSWELESADELLVALQKLSLRQMERLQRLSENLARSNRDLEDFAFIASHDMQAPLRKIEAFSGLISKELEKQPSDMDRVKDYLIRVSQASARLRTLITDLLTYSRVGRLDYEPEECDWKQIIEKCVDLVGDQIDYSDFSITVSGEFPITPCSPVLLQMIFQNLLSNALKYSDEARPNAIKITGTPAEDGRNWRVTVADTGIGFDPDKARAIFEPFMRLDSSSLRPGSGIGLAIVKKAADRLGVTVTATSEPGQGSIFLVSTALPGH